MKFEYNFNKSLSFLGKRTFIGLAGVYLSYCLLLYSGGFITIFKYLLPNKTIYCETGRESMNADINNLRDNENERSITTTNSNNTHSNPNATNVTNSSNNSNIGNNSTTLHQPIVQPTGINRNTSTRTMRSA